MMTKGTRTQADKEKHVGQSGERLPSESVPMGASHSYADILTLQRTAGNQAVKSVFQNGSGQPLDHATQNDMENQFGTDFREVRVHTDHQAHLSAENLDAQAYAVGHHVVFSSHRYQPFTPSGRGLLAHELSHVIQQRGNAGNASPAHESVSEQIEHEVNSPGPGEERNLSALASKAGSASIQVQAKPEQNRTGPHRPVLTPEIEEEMTQDVEAIVKKLRNFDRSLENQQVLVSIIEKYVQADKEYGTFTQYKGSAFLDSFLIKLKMRVFKRSSIRSMWVDQPISAYDALWNDLKDVWLEKFKGFVARSQTQGTKGPELAPLENPWATISRQEAIGMWGMLKGMGTGLIGVASPIAAEKIGKNFDESGQILFGKEWSEGPDLDFGHGIHLNARQIGTAGGNVIMQLALLGKGKSSASFANAQKILGVASNLQGVGAAANQIAALVTQMQQSGTLSVENLMTNPEFLGQCAALIANIYGSLTGASSSGNKTLQARIQLLLQGPQAAAEIGKIIQIQNSEKPVDVKHRETGEVIVGLIGQMVGILMGTVQYQQEHGKGTSSGPNVSNSKEGHNTKSAPIEGAPEKVTPTGTTKPGTIKAKSAGPALASRLLLAPMKGTAESIPATQDTGAGASTHLAQSPANPITELVSAPKSAGSPELHPESHSQIPAETRQPKSEMVTEPIVPEVRSVPHNEFEPEIDLTKETGLELMQGNSETRAVPHAEFEPTGDLKGKSGLSLAKTKRAREEVARRRPAKQNFGEPSGEEVGTEHRKGQFFREMNAAEIGPGRLRIKYDQAAGRPIKVTFEVSAETLAGTQQTDRSFKPDPSVETAQPSSDAFTHSGYDRAHLAPRETFKESGEMERAVDQTTNIIPMKPDLNQQIWRHAETQTKALAKAHGAVRVEIEPIYDAKPLRLEDGTPIPKAIRRRVTTLDGKVLEDTSYLNR